MEFNHKPIMLNEVISGLNINPEGTYIDCTLGGGGHSYALLSHLSKSGRLVGIDKDKDAIAFASKRLQEFQNVTYVHDDYTNVENIFYSANLSFVDGVLIDLGVSSYQLDETSRGFSFKTNARLDMRMNQEQSLDAYTVVNTYSENRLIEIFYKFGEEFHGRQIARKIVQQRKIKPIETTFELKDIVESAYPKKEIYRTTGVAKKAFQAIRIEVNGELDKLEKTLEFLISKLKSHGRIAVLTFHSLEDRIVKNVFRKESTDCLCPPKTPICICHHKATLKLITKKPLVASTDEQEQNSRSTCAKLRIAEKI